MFRKNKETSKKKNWLFLVVVFLYIYKRVFRAKNKHALKDLEHNFKEFLQKETKEVKEYTKGKENLEEFLEDSGSIFKDYFIPHTGNNHHPKILHTKSLLIMTLLAVTLKFSLVFYLYFLFPTSSKADSEMIARVMSLVNQERQSYNIDPLEYNDVLSASAQTRAQDMIDRDYFAHTTPDGKKPWDFVNRADYKYILVGENLAMNFSSAESAHKALLNSPSHKKNLLNKKYEDIGLAIIRGNIAGKESLIMVQLFSAEQESVQEAVVVQETKPSIEETSPKEDKVEQLESKSIENKVATLGIDSENIEKPAVVEKTIPEPEPKASLETKQEKSIPKEYQQASIEKVIQSEDEATIMEDEQKAIRVLKHPGDEMLARSVEEQIDYHLLTAAQVDKTLPELETVIEHSTESGFFISESLIRITQTALALILSLVIVAMMINVIVRFEIQHKPVLLRTAVLVVFVVALLFINFHSLEGGIQTIYLS